MNSNTKKILILVYFLISVLRSFNTRKTFKQILLLSVEKQQARERQHDPKLDEVSTEEMSFGLFVLCPLAKGSQDRISVRKHILFFAPVSLLVMKSAARISANV